MTTQSNDPDGSTQQPHEQIADDHANLRRLLDQLLATDDVRRMVPQLTDLRAELIEHFELEEGAEGLASIILETAPNSLNRLDRLFEEHQAFLATIEGIIAQANAYLAGPVAELKGRVQSLCSRLEAHEATETELISEAVFTDLGTSG